MEGFSYGRLEVLKFTIIVRHKVLGSIEITLNADNFDMQEVAGACNYCKLNSFATHVVVFRHSIELLCPTAKNTT
jgi:hypothetical protein